MSGIIRPGRDPFPLDPVNNFQDALIEENELIRKENAQLRIKINNLGLLIDRTRLLLKNATRRGKKQDIPEGSRYIILSDSLAKRIVNEIEKNFHQS